MKRNLKSQTFIPMENIIIKVKRSVRKENQSRSYHEDLQNFEFIPIFFLKNPLKIEINTFTI